MAPRIDTAPLACECTCEFDAMCPSQAPGHGLSFIQERLARATPRHWVDAVVEGVASTDGWLTVRTLDGEALRLWNHRLPDVEDGEPVALHGAYRVLAVGSVRLNVAIGVAAKAAATA